MPRGDNLNHFAAGVLAVLHDKCVEPNEWLDATTPRLRLTGDFSVSNTTPALAHQVAEGGMDENLIVAKGLQEGQ